MSKKGDFFQPFDEKEMEARYRRAEAFMQGLRTQSLVQNDNIKPQWIEQSECFWYPRYYQIENNTGGAIGKEVRLVDATSLSNKQAFDHIALAQALNRASGHEVNANDLPIHNITLSIKSSFVRFEAFSQCWTFDSNSESCTPVESEAPHVSLGELLSPDNKKIAFLRDSNLWVREVITGEERALTDDGEPFFRYGGLQSAGGVDVEDINASWSPDSKTLFTVQRDTRQVKTWPMVNHVPDDDQLRPTLEPIKLAMQGDEHREQYRLLIVDVSKGEQIEAQYPRMDTGADDFGFFNFSHRAWWAKDSRRSYFIDYQGDYKVLRLVELDAQSGATRVLFEETSDTYVNFYPEYMESPLHRYLPDTDELIWWSERSGWGHLYLYDLNSGQLKHAISQIDASTEAAKGWRVRNILHVDTASRELLIQTAGRFPSSNPYYRDICRIHIDTGELTTLLSSDHDYCVHKLTQNEIEMFCIPDADGNISGVSPSASYMVTARARVDQAPVSLLLNRGGDTLLEIETTDVTKLPEDWQWPEPVSMTAADGKTELYGVLFRPSAFSEDKRYPVINMIVGGPWLCAVPQGSFHHKPYIDRYYFQAAALAELGFMVVIIDSRGTPLRSKAFQEISYGWMPSGANSEDHRGAIEQLAERYPSMDLNRVGVYSPTGYHGGLQNLFEHPEFYSVGVICSHMDARLASCTSEHFDKYQGSDVPPKGKAYPEDLASNWDGKLLFVLSMANPVYPAAGTLRVVDTLQKANKEVDLLASPGGDLMGGYEQRRVWDYFVTNLQGAEPPKEFMLGDFQW